MKELAIQEAVRVAKAGIAGEVDILNASNQLLSSLSRAEVDSDFQIFRLISSDSDHLPIGSDRAMWNPDALARKDKEIEEVEAFYRDDFMAACDEVIKRFGGSPS